MNGEAGPDFKGVVVAAGRSSRFGASLPKQFHDLGGRSVLEHAVHAVADRPAVSGVIVVLPADEIGGPWDRTAAAWPCVERVVAGGASRAESVWRGLSATGDVPYVLVHDGARPLVSAGLVDAVIDATRRHGAAVPILEIPDTVKSVDGVRVTGTLSRNGLGLAQTPQGARTDWLRVALESAGSERSAFTDEAAALEHLGHAVAAVPGEPSNRKITDLADLAEARRRVEPRATVLRVGTGFDVHRVDPERPLVLGGVRFEDEPGLAGHSDADVVLHAAMDALLGAVGLGDIGLHFPPDDRRFAGAASTDLARRVAALLDARGYRIVNLDLTLLAETPRIRDRVEGMRVAIAECLATEPTRIGLKATTLEGLGALGRGEGVACQAVALVASAGTHAGP
jgi:2-C-methyl-D-erythritol 4-phosphate cytidylyltransferase/2-C-methyl-D-erythritol 2,4-cyclodiphosphate synthase